MAASGVWGSRWLAGPLLLTRVFQGSTWLTEQLTVRKYPAYREYQRTTARLVPLPPGAGGVGGSR